MRSLGWVGIVVLGWGAVAARAQGTCDAAQLPAAAKEVAAVRRTMQKEPGPREDGAIPAAVQAQLARLKSGLTTAAEGAFRCAPAAVGAETMEKMLRDALHAQTLEAGAAATDTGAFGEDLAVQVFSLADQPRLMEVDFRWGLGCGDDHLLLVFEAGEHAADRWRALMQWSAAQTGHVGDALGDFVMLAPLTGSVTAPQWRFAVAHGHPACGEVPRESRFDLDLLAPTADPAKPRVDWHYAHGYVQDNVAPSLATTEDTLVFRMVHKPLDDKPGAAVPAPEVYQFRLIEGVKVEPVAGTPGGDSGERR